jgi:ankyrin repeat protein
LEKKVNKYRAVQPQGFLTKYENGDWKVEPDVLLKFTSCNLRELKAIIFRGADVNIKMARDFTILHKMAFCGTLEHIKFLLAQGAEINAQTTDGYTALIPALSNKTDSYNIVKLLLESGADFSLVYKGNTVFVDKLDALTREKIEC